jgi:hypothetical protein
MSASTKSLLTRTITSKLEIERKFVPTPLLLKYASENSNNEILTLPPAAFTAEDRTSSHVVLSRLPRKRVTDKYFDRAGALESKGIWVRWRREQTTAHDGNGAETSSASGADGFWEAKIKQGGLILASQKPSAPTSPRSRAGMPSRSCLRRLECATLSATSGMSSGSWPTESPGP